MKVKYEKALDYLLVAADAQSKGKFEEAAKALHIATKTAGFDRVMAQLDTLQTKLRDREAAAETAAAEGARQSKLAKALEAAAAKKPKKKVKAKPFGGKKAPPFKKKVKADAESEQFDQTIDDMVNETAEDEDLDILDIEEVLNDDPENELPVASEETVEAPTMDLDGEGLLDDDADEVLSEDDSEDEDDEEDDDEKSEETSEDESDDEDKDDEEDDGAPADEEAKPATAKARPATAKPSTNVAKARVQQARQNLAALARLQTSAVKK